MSTEHFAPSPDRVKKFTEGVVREYEQHSIVKRCINWRIASPDEEGEFVRIGLRFAAKPETFVDELSLGGTVYHPEIFGIGRSIAIAEEKYILAQAEKSFETQEVETRANMVDHLRGSFPFTPAVAFIPIAYYMELHKSVDPQFRIQYLDGPQGYLKIGDSKARVYWSNRYVEFDKFFFLASGSAEWIVKPDHETGSWVRVKVQTGKPGEFDVTAETVALFKPLDLERGIIFALKERPPEE